jgi:LytR cell envelope-related transcriptional attenuator
VEHAQPFDRPFPWRAAALAAAAVAVAELAALLALAGIRVLDVHHAGAVRPTQTRPAPDTGQGPKRKAPLRSRSNVSVLVLNGNGVSGAAGTEASALLARGYRHAVPRDASQTYASSLVLFRRGWQGEAQRLAHDAGIRSVAPLDGRLPSTDAGYRLVLILGAN